MEVTAEQLISAAEAVEKQIIIAAEAEMELASITLATDRKIAEEYLKKESSITGNNPEERRHKETYVFAEDFLTILEMRKKVYAAKAELEARKVTLRVLELVAQLQLQK